jgi:hypothetical protein
MRFPVAEVDAADVAAPPCLDSVRDREPMG